MFLAVVLPSYALLSSPVVEFSLSATYDSGGNEPGSVAVGDLNGDGHLDLVVVNYCNNGCSSGTVGVLLGNGDGTFQPTVSYDSGGGSLWVALADVNGDGKPDILVANWDDDKNDLGSLGVLLCELSIFPYDRTAFPYQICVGFSGDHHETWDRPRAPRYRKVCSRTCRSGTGSCDYELRMSDHRR